jgi:hypothetical protein
MPALDKYHGKTDEQIRQMTIDAFGADFRREADEVSKELLSESPRASVLVGAAWLDDYLRRMIASALPPDELTQRVFLGTLRSLGQRINAARDLGIISESEKVAMDLAKQIRNAFAHRTSVSFDNPDVQALAAKLEPHLPDTYAPGSAPIEEPRRMYVALVSYYVASLASREKYAREMSDLDLRLEFMRFVATEKR